MQIDFLGNIVRGDFFLVMLLLVLGTGAFVIALFAKRRRRSGNDLERLLSSPEILDALKTGNQGLRDIIEYVKAQEQHPARDGMITALSTKIVNDIDWDVAGLIGVGVTVVLLFMVVSGTVSQAPEQIFTGWLLILGYYFGKGSKK